MSPDWHPVALPRYRSTQHLIGSKLPALMHTASRGKSAIAVLKQLTVTPALSSDKQRCFALMTSQQPDAIISVSVKQIPRYHFLLSSAACLHMFCGDPLPRAPAAPPLPHCPLRRLERARAVGNSCATLILEKAVADLRLSRHPAWCTAIK